jgi:hypothetical protein
VQKTVAGACGSRSEVALFHKTMGNAAQSQIPGYSAAGRSTADNNHIRFNHCFLRLFLYP